MIRIDLAPYNYAKLLEILEKAETMMTQERDAELAAGEINLEKWGLIGNAQALRELVPMMACRVDHLGRTIAEEVTL
jgi:hypothetical protein